MNINSAAASNMGPKQVSMAEKLRLDQAEKENAFKTKPLEHVIEKWQKQVMQNEQ